jgi:hypothetical protein
MLNRLVDQLIVTFEEYNINNNHRNLFLSIIKQQSSNVIAPLVVKEIDNLKNKRAVVN